MAIKWFRRPAWLSLSSPGGWRVAGLRRFSVRRVEEALGVFVSIVLKLGTLLLLALLVTFVLRVFSDQGYVIEPFSVPEELAKSGYDGAVVARRIQDEVLALKTLASSVKEDSLLLTGDQQPELDVAVLGIGFSLRSVTYHLRELLGRKNKLIRGEITLLGDTYNLTLRMSGFAPVKQDISLGEHDGDPRRSVERLLRRGGEAVLSNLDPYRMAVVCYKENRHEEAVRLVRRILAERPREASWAYVAWGSVLENQNQHVAAADKFRRAVELDPDFGVGLTRLAQSLERLGQGDEALTLMRRNARLNPGNLSAWVTLAWMHHRRQDFPAADSAFREATRRANANEAEVWLGWADSRVSRGDLDGADSIFRVAAPLLRENVEGYLARALSAFARRDTAGAVDRILTAFALDPSHPGAIQLGIRGAFLIREYRTAVDIFQRADWQLLTGEQKQTVYNLAAMSYNLLGRPDSAMAVVRQAIAMAPSVGYPYSTLAETHAFQGRLDSCYFYLERAFQLGMDPAMITPDMPPYPTLFKQERFRRLRETYTRLKG